MFVTYIQTYRHTYIQTLWLLESLDLLDRETKNSNVNRPQSYECSYCDVIFYNRKERDLHHKIVHHEDTRGLFKCESCNTTAITKSRLEYHIENYCQKTYNKL